MNTVTPVGIGYFADRYGPKLTNIAGSVLFSVAAMLFSVSLLYSMCEGEREGRGERGEGGEGEGRERGGRGESEERDREGREKENFFLVV